nr:putative uncharacterized protein FLJ46235 [Aotus nancymaae]
MALQAQLLPLGGLSGPKVSPSQPLKAELFLPAVPRGPAPASRQPLSAQLLPSSCGLSRPSLCLTEAQLTVAPAGPAPVLSQAVRAQNFLKVSSSDPAPASRWPLQAQFLHPGGLTRQLSQVCHSRSKSCLPSASPGPASASPQRPQSKLLPFSSPDRPRSCPRHALQAGIFLKLAAPG